ncbi:MAG: hypothetical protein HQ498_00515 [Pseudohongiella sp.]|nr:hypothetical protein [Pseudohongiella sp.]
MQSFFNAVGSAMNSAVGSAVLKHRPPQARLPFLAEPPASGVLLAHEPAALIVRQQHPESRLKVWKL